MLAIAGTIMHVTCVPFENEELALGKRKREEEEALNPEKVIAAEVSLKPFDTVIIAETDEEVEEGMVKAKAPLILISKDVNYSTAFLSLVVLSMFRLQTLPASSPTVHRISPFMTRSGTRRIDDSMARISCSPVSFPAQNRNSHVAFSFQTAGH